MSRQLTLIDPSEIDWRLDDRTKELGRRGISEARAALRRRVAPVPAAMGATR